MKITCIIYSFHKNCVIVKQPVEIVKETVKCYFTAYGNRIMKSEIGKPTLMSPTEYTYVRLLLVDADEATLREELSKWFTQKAYEVWKMPKEQARQQEGPVTKEANQEMDVCPICGKPIEVNDGEDNGYGELHLYWKCESCGNTGKAVIDQQDHNAFLYHEVE